MTSTEVPVGNIGARGCRRRRAGGWFWTIVVVIALVVMLVKHTPPAWAIVLSLPIALAALGFLQAREQTCVFHAALGTRENDDGVVKLDPRVRAEVSRRAWRVGVSSLLIAVVVSALIAVILRR